MKFLALIYATEGTEPQPGTPEFGPFMKGYEDASAAYQKDNAMLAGEALLPVATAKSVRIRNGKAEVMDGPFAETKEQLGGFYLLDCPDMETAVNYAKLIPSADHGTVEVRPVMTFD